MSDRELKSCPCCYGTNIKEQEVRFITITDGVQTKVFDITAPPDDILFTCECGCAWRKSKRRASAQEEMSHE